MTYGQLNQKNAELGQKRTRLEEERRSRLMVLIRQVRNFMRKEASEEGCAEMLAVDIDIVDRIYRALQEHPDSGDAEILDMFKESEGYFRLA